MSHTVHPVRTIRVPGEDDSSGVGGLDLVAGENVTIEGERDGNTVTVTISATGGGGGGGTPSGSVVAGTSYGQAAAAGSSSSYSRGDHTHGTPALSSATPQPLGVAAAGAALTPSRADHVHAMPSASDVGADAAGTASAAVAAEAATRAAADTAEASARATADALLVPQTRTVSAGTGLTGGGSLAADRTLAVAYGSSSGTAAEGNDARLSDARTPTGAAGGDLAGSYPNPTVTQARGLRETSGPSTLSIGAIAEGQVLACVGGAIIGVYIASSVVVGPPTHLGMALGAEIVLSTTVTDAP